MKELGIDDKGRKMVLTDDGKLKIVAGTVSATMSRNHLLQTIATHQAEVEKWTKYLNVLDEASTAESPATTADVASEALLVAEQLIDDYGRGVAVCKCGHFSGNHNYNCAECRCQSFIARQPKEGEGK